jgi:hypothetical protein
MLAESSQVVMQFPITLPASHLEQDVTLFTVGMIDFECTCNLNNCITVFCLSLSTVILCAYVSVKFILKI